MILIITEQSTTNVEAYSPVCTISVEALPHIYNDIIHINLKRYIVKRYDIYTKRTDIDKLFIVSEYIARCVAI